MLKHYTQWLQTIQEYETIHKTRINNNIKTASVVNTIADFFFQSTKVIRQTNSGGQGYQGHQPLEIDQINGFKGKKGKGKSKGPPVKGKGKGKKGKGKQNQIQEWGHNQNQQTGYRPRRPGHKITISISSPQENRVHNTKARAKAKASHQ
eukprot:892962-Amphidinium_carterae.2